MGLAQPQLIKREEKPQQISVLQGLPTEQPVSAPFGLLGALGSLQGSKGAVQENGRKKSIVIVMSWVFKKTQRTQLEDETVGHINKAPNTSDNFLQQKNPLILESCLFSPHFYP